MAVSPKRIMIFGRSGSGKSTFALALHRSLHLPLYHLDKYFFEENWQERDYQEFLRIQQAIVDGDLWIIDGNCTKSLAMRYNKADLVLYFNYPRWLCYFRVCKRLCKKDIMIDDRAYGCKEKISFKFLRYMWSFEKRVSNKIDFLKEKYPATCFVEIKNNKELENFKSKLIATHRAKRS